MRTKVKLAIVMALCLTAGSTAFAQDREPRSTHQMDHRRDMNHQEGRRNDRVHYADVQRDARHDGRGWGAGPRHDLYKGGRLDREYRGRYYRVDDWRGHGLYAPPRGYYWAQVGADYVLVAITTGIILNVMLAQ